jgi:hypothetical protein
MLSETGTNAAVFSGTGPAADYQRRSYLGDVYRQTIALLMKNYTLAISNRTTTFLRIFSSAFFILLIFLVNEGLKARFAVETFFKDLPNPDTKAIDPIPACTPKYGKSDCITLVYSPAPYDSFVPSQDYLSLAAFNASVQCTVTDLACAEMFRVHKIVRGIMKNNGRSAFSNESVNEIPSSKVFGFRSPLTMDSFLSQRPDTVQGGYIFSSRTENETTFIIQQNSTVTQVRGAFQQPYRKYTLPMQVQAYREIVRLFDTAKNVDMLLKEFAHPALAVSTFEATVAPLFLIGGMSFDTWHAALIIFLSNSPISAPPMCRRGFLLTRPPRYQVRCFPSSYRSARS